MKRYKNRTIMMSFLLLLSLFQSSQAFAFNWTSTNADASHQRFVNEFIAPPLEKKWNLYHYGGLSPAIERNTVYVVPKLTPSHLAAVDLITGRVKWKYRFDDDGQGDGIYYHNGFFHSHPAVKNGIVYVGSMERFYAMRDKGNEPEILWSVPLKLDNTSAIVTDHTIYAVNRGSNLIALDSNTGKRKWGTQIALSHHAPALGEGKLFAPWGTTLRAYQDKGSTYTTLWTKKLGTTGKLTQVIYREGVLYTGLEQALFAIEAKTGNVLWKASLPSKVTEAAALGASRLFVNLSDGTTLSVDSKTGKTVWKVNQQADGAPMLVGSTLYVSSYNQLKAFNSSTGQLIDTIHVVDNRGFRGMALSAANDFILASVEGNEFVVVGLVPKFKNIKVNVDLNPLTFDILPKIVNGRTLVPMRGIFEALGATVEWDGTTKTVTATKEDRTVKLEVGQSKAWVNNEEYVLDTAPQIFTGRTVVPLRFVSEALDTTVKWNGDTRTVSIYSFVDFGLQSLYIDGKLIDSGILLSKRQNGLFLDAKPLFEHLGGQIEVHYPIFEVIVKVQDEELRFNSERSVTVGGKQIAIHGPLFMSEELSEAGHFYIDFDFITKAYGWEIQWDRSNKAIRINTNPAQQ